MNGGSDPQAQRDPGSFRDPAGFVFHADGIAYRQISPSFADEWDDYIESGLYARLRDDGTVIAHEEADPDLAPHPPAHMVIRPEQLEVISYPYEWSFSQLKDAALLTLRAQAAAAEMGMSLRDASAYNIQFLRGRPVLIDSLSFERAQQDRPWAPYRQFCEHFLAPLALMARVDIRLGRMQRDNIDGIPLDLAARMLPGRTRLSFGLGPHIHLHARAQQRHASDSATSEDVSSGRPMSASKRANLIESLRTTIEGLTWKPEGTEWADYADNTSYDDDATAAKVASVSAMLDAAGGTRAWDLGANTGRYSGVATRQGYSVVALDIDPAAVERGYRAIRKEGRGDILPLLADLTDPSPALGWGSAERAALLDRIDTDVILALALVHHLAIGANVPLPMVANQFARMAPQAIVEWVPKDDAMVKRLLASRNDIFDEYCIDGFRTAFGSRYDIVSEIPISGTKRTLFHLQRRE